MTGHTVILWDRILLCMLIEREGSKILKLQNGFFFFFKPQTNKQHMGNF